MKKEESTHEEGELNQETPNLSGVSTDHGLTNKMILCPIIKDIGNLPDCMSDGPKRHIEYEMNR